MSASQEHDALPTPTEQRLLELLSLKDAQLEKAARDVGELQRRIDFGIDWMLHRRIPYGADEEAGAKLPIPRVEMRLTVNVSRYRETQVTLVLPCRDSSVNEVPLHYSKSGGAAPFDVEEYPVAGRLTESQIQQLPGTLNDACFFMEQTGIPAYVVLDESRKYVVTSLRPLVLDTVLP